MSSAEAKYVAIAGCCANILWMKSQLTDYDIIYKKIPIFCDNPDAIVISNNPVLHLRIKHIDIRYHFIEDHILERDIELHFIPTQYQLADIFTKPLDETTFKRLIVKLGKCGGGDDDDGLLVDRRDGDGGEAGGVKRLWRRQVVSEGGGVVVVGGVVVPTAMVAVHGDGEVVVWVVAGGESGGGAVGRWQWCCMSVVAGCNGDDDGSRVDNGVVSVEMMGLTVVAVVDVVAAAVGVSGVGGGLVMEMWRLGCMATVGGESDRSGDGKCFWGSPKKFAGKLFRWRRPAAGGWKWWWWPAAKVAGGGRERE
nr:retrovirus-related Pol polyprotein from transposon TNT 1-94 [Tanacetum cinerariifolium]